MQRITAKLMHFSTCKTRYPNLIRSFGTSVGGNSPIETDVVVVGGDITGCAIACALSKS
jgi:hypothetical protein